MSSKRPKISEVFADTPQDQHEQVSQKQDEVEMKGVLFRLNKLAKVQLDLLAAEHSTSKQELLCEAVNDLFHKYKKERIA